MPVFYELTLGVAVAQGTRDIGPAQVMVADQQDCGSYAYFFAAQNYDNPDFKDLSTPSRDVRTIASLMERKFGFEIRTFENATRAILLGVLDELLVQTKECDQVLVYYAGHGAFRKQTEQGFWQPVDATPHSSSWISNHDVVDRLRNVNARHVLLVVDSCFSGSLIEDAMRGADAPRRSTDRPEDAQRLVDVRSRWVLTSGGNEPVADTYDNRGMSVFAYFLHQELERTNRPWFSAEDLFAELRRNVVANTSQRPRQFAMKGHEGGALLFENRFADPKGGSLERTTTPVKRFQGSHPTQRDGAQDELDPPVAEVWIEGGAFMMGSAQHEPDRQDDEARHRVDVASFWIMRSEVTRALYQDVMGIDPSATPGEPTQPLKKSETAQRPVESVSWWDAVHFANALSKRHRLPEAYVIQGEDIRWLPSAIGYRLPTEAEWEYAARSRTSTSRFSGSMDANEVGWIEGRTGSHPVCTKTQNEIGLCDMTGNVAEWTWDVYRHDATHQTNRQSGVHARVHRGGHWHSRKAAARVAARDFENPNAKENTLGFRLVRSGQ